MPVTTVSADQVTFGANGRPILAANSSTSNGPRSSNGPHYSRKFNNNRYKCRAEQLTPRLDLVTAGSPVALDCEGVLLVQETSFRRRGLGRCSITNTQSQVVYDTFVFYPDDVEHRPSPQRLHLGVKYNDILEKNGAQPHAQVLEAAKTIFDKSGIIVAHSATDDELMMSGIDFSQYVVRDTQAFSEYRRGRRGQAKLRDLAYEYFGNSIQVEEHSSVEDARATMDLFLLHHTTFEVGCDFTGKPLTSGAQAGTTNSATSSPTQGSSAPGSKLAPGHLVALPDIKSMAKGRVFDRKTSTYH